MSWLGFWKSRANSAGTFDRDVPPARAIFNEHARALRQRDDAAASVLLDALRGIGHGVHASIEHRDWLASALFDAHRASLVRALNHAERLLNELRGLAARPDATDKQREQFTAALDDAVNVARERSDTSAVDAFETERVVWQPLESPVPQAQAWYAAAGRLLRLQRTGEALLAFERIVFQLEGSMNVEVRSIVARALVTRARTLGQLGYVDDELRTYDRILREFDVQSTLADRRCLAATLFHKGVRLTERRAYLEAVQCHSLLVNRFRDTIDAELRLYVVMSLVNRGCLLSVVGRLVEALVDYDDVLSVCDPFDSLELRRQAAFALCNKTSVLESLGRDREANETRELLVARFFSDGDPSIQEALTTALQNHGLHAAKHNQSSS